MSVFSLHLAVKLSMTVFVLHLAVTLVMTVLVFHLICTVILYCTLIVGISFRLHTGYVSEYDCFASLLSMSTVIECSKIWNTFHNLFSTKMLVISDRSHQNVSE